jgi:hypothetical protein
MRNRRNIKQGSTKNALTNDWERGTIGSKNMNRRVDRSNRMQQGRIRSHMKRSSSIKKFLEKKEVVTQCQKTQSQNQQNLSVKNPKHQAGIEAALSHAQRGARLERSRYNQVSTRSCHPHT